MKIGECGEDQVAADREIEADKDLSVSCEMGLHGYFLHGYFSLTVKYSLSMSDT